MGSYGLAGPNPILFTAADTDTAAILAQTRLQAAAATILEAAYLRVCAMIDRHRGAVERIAAALIAMRCIDGHTVARLIGGERDVAAHADGQQARSVRPPVGEEVPSCVEATP